MVSGVRRGMGVLDVVVIVEWKWAALWVNLGRPVVTDVDFATWLFPNYFGQYLLTFFHTDSDASRSLGAASPQCNAMHVAR